MPSGLSQKFEAAGLRNCEQKIWSSWAADRALQDNATLAIQRLIRPSLAAVLQDGDAGTVKTSDDIARIERDLRKDVEEKGVQVGFDYFWNWGQRPA